MATMGTIGGGIFLSTRGGGAPKKTEQGPPIAASSKDEENFIQYVFVNLRALDSRKGDT